MLSITESALRRISADFSLGLDSVQPQVRPVPPSVASIFLDCVLGLHVKYINTYIFLRANSVFVVGSLFFFPCKDLVSLIATTKILTNALFLRRIER